MSGINSDDRAKYFWRDGQRMVASESGVLRMLAAERERIAQAIAEEVADRVTWDDGTEYIACADAARIARGDA